MTTPPARILLVDDHELFRTGIASLLNAQPDFEVVGQSSDGLEAYYHATALNPDLILMDINMPGVNGLEAVNMILSDLPNAIVIMLTVHDDDEQVFNAIRSGAKGYILKNTNSDEFLKMLRTGLKGDAALSPKLTGKILNAIAQGNNNEEEDNETPDNQIILTRRETEVLKHISQGLADKEIANTLNISLHTVKSHVRNILSKLQVENRNQAAAYAKKAGYFS